MLTEKFCITPRNRESHEILAQRTLPRLDIYRLYINNYFNTILLLSDDFYPC